MIFKFVKFLNIKMVSSVCLYLFITKLSTYEPNLTSEIYEILVTYFIRYVNSKVPSGYYFSIKNLWYNVNILKCMKYLDYMNYIINDMDWFDCKKYRTMYKAVLHCNKTLIIHNKHFNSGYTLGMYFTSYNRYKRYDRYANFRCLSFFEKEKSNIWKLNRHIATLPKPKPKYNDNYLNKKKFRKNQNYMFRNRKM